MTKKSNTGKTDRDLMPWIESINLTLLYERTLLSLFCKRLLLSSGIRLMCVKHLRGGHLYVNLGGTAVIIRPEALCFGTVFCYSLRKEKYLKKGEIKWLMQQAKELLWICQ